MFHVHWLSVFRNSEQISKGLVHTYPDIFESATFSFRVRLPSTRIRRIRQRIRIFSNPLSRAQLFEGRLALNPGLSLTRASSSFVQKPFLR